MILAASPLTIAHRTAQLKIARATLKALIRIWPLFDPKDIDTSWRGIEQTLMLLIGNGRSASISLAQSYYQAIRATSTLTAPLPLVILTNDWQTPAMISLHVTGPAYTKSSILANRDLDLAAKDALVRVSGAATRHVLNGGRDYLSAAVRADRIGWRRVTDADPCKFCAMLRDRGAVYREETAKFLSHDHCGCTAEPVFRRSRNASS